MATQTLPQGAHARTSAILIPFPASHRRQAGLLLPNPAEIIPFPTRKPAPVPEYTRGQFVAEIMELTALWKAAGLWRDPEQLGSDVGGAA